MSREGNRTRPRQRSMHDLLELERALAGVLELSDFAGSLLNRLQRLIGASGATLSCYDHGQARMPTLQGGTLERVMQEYPSDLFREDPIYAWNLRTPPSLFIATGEGFDFSAFAKTRPYVDFYRPREIGYMCGVRPTGLPYGSRNMFGLMFSTPTLSQPFDVKRLDGMRQLEVPLRAAAARIARFRGMQHKQDVLSQLLERKRGSFVIWDADGRMAWISSEGQRHVDGPLPRSDLEHAATLALRQLRRTDTPRRDALLGRARQLRSARGTPLLVEFSWVDTADRRPWLLAEIRPCAGASARLAKLSHSEARVLRLLTQGLSNREISELLAVSQETVKTHVQRILAKLDVSSRAKAVRVALEEWRP
jgi:DNA-binding CsgD family transcriptional regulator